MHCGADTEVEPMPLTPLISGIVVSMAGVTGMVAGPFLRAQMVRYAVPPREPWCTACPACAAPLPLALPYARCRSCAEPLGPGPGVVELLAAVICEAVAWRTVSSVPQGTPPV